ncbi:MAG: cupin domain-containing protein [Vulcanococcus sp.]
MALRRSIEICANPGSTAGPAFFRDPVPSNETLIAELQPSAAPELFCHRHQTDQLMVLRGSIELVVLQNRRLHRITLREDEPTWVRIPPGVPHGAINRGPTLALVVNAVLRHRPSDGRDYLSRPVPAALASAWADLQDDRVRQDLADWS